MGIDIEAHLAFDTALGRNEDDTVTAPHTVNGRGRGVLQHRHRLDLVHVHVLHATLDTVHQDQRRRTGPRRHAADEYLCLLLARLAARREGRESRNQSVQGARKRGHAARALELLALDLSDGAHHALLFLYAVADHHDLLDIERLGLKRDVDGLLGMHGNRLVGHAEVTEPQRLAAPDLDRIGAEQVRGDAPRSTDHNH